MYDTVLGKESAVPKYSEEAICNTEKLKNTGVPHSAGGTVVYYLQE
jgi:hypothetical protein